MAAYGTGYGTGYGATYGGLPIVEVPDKITPELLTDYAIEILQGKSPEESIAKNLWLLPDAIMIPVTGIASFAGKIAGALAGLPVGKAVEWSEAAAEKLSYMPRAPITKKLFELATPVFEAISKVTAIPGDWIEEVTDSETAGLFADISLEVAAWIYGPGIARGIKAGFVKGPLSKLPGYAGAKLAREQKAFIRGIEREAALPPRGEVVGKRLPGERLPPVPSTLAPSLVEPSISAVLTRSVFKKWFTETLDETNAKRLLDPEIELSGIRQRPPQSDASLKVSKAFSGEHVRTERVKQYRKTNISSKIQQFLVNRDANLRKQVLSNLGVAGVRSMNHRDLIRGASAGAARQIDDAYKVIYGGRNDTQKIFLDDVIRAKGIISLEEKNLKHTAGRTVDEIKTWLSERTPEQMKWADERSNLYGQVTKGLLHDLKSEGRISAEVADSLADRFYVPQRNMKYIDGIDTLFKDENNQLISVTDGNLTNKYERLLTKETPNEFANRKALGAGPLFAKLKGGTEEAKYTDTADMLQAAQSKTAAYIIGNNANKALAKAIDASPESGIGRRLTKGDTPTANEGTIFYYTGGNLNKYAVRKDVFHEWVNTRPAINMQHANIISWITGTKLLKAMATGYNPAFAIPNLVRDIVHMHLNTSEYSRFAPMAAAQMAVDFTATLPQAFKGFRFKKTIKREISERAAGIVEPTKLGEKFSRAGGGANYLTQEGTFNIAHKSLNNLASIFSYLGNSTEKWTRLAVMRRAIRNGKGDIDAAHVARDYLDFSKGGSFTMALNSGIPYLNAAVQAGYTLARTAYREPALVAMKAAQIMTADAGMNIANRIVNPECWDNISDVEKNNNFIITSPFTYVDQDGQTRYRYFKIPKAESIRGIAAVLDGLVGMEFGEDVNPEKIESAMTSVLPIMSLPPVITGMVGYGLNKDLWLKQDIWSGPTGIQAKEEYRASTNPAFVRLGEMLNVSPERSKYFLQKFFTYGNVFTAMAGAGARQIFDSMEGVEKQNAIDALMESKPIVKRFYTSTHPRNRYAKERDALRSAGETERWKSRRQLDIYVNRYIQDGSYQNKRAIETYIDTQPPQEQKRLLNRRNFLVKMKELKDPGWWYSVKGLPTGEMQALMFWHRYSKADFSERKFLMDEAKVVPGLYRNKFFDALAMLTRAAARY